MFDIAGNRNFQHTGNRNFVWVIEVCIDISDTILSDVVGNRNFKSLLDRWGRRC